MENALRRHKKPRRKKKGRRNFDPQLAHRKYHRCLPAGGASPPTFTAQVMEQDAAKLFIAAYLQTEKGKNATPSLPTSMVTTHQRFCSSGCQRVRLGLSNAGSQWKLGICWQHPERIVRTGAVRDALSAGKLELVLVPCRKRKSKSATIFCRISKPCEPCPVIAIAPGYQMEKYL